MIVNNHRKHSSFALRHFIAGGCHTPDAAYCLLYAQMEQIEMDVAAGQDDVIETEARDLELDLEAERVKDDPVASLRNQAERIKHDSMKKNFKLNYEGAIRELQEIQNLLEQLKPHCKYWDEDIIKMEQNMQHDEWVGELKARAENFQLANVLGIPHDHVATMRQHPEFASQILPHLTKVSETIRTSMQLGQPDILIKSISAPKIMDLYVKDPILLEEEKKATALESKQIADNGEIND